MMSEHVQKMNDSHDRFKDCAFNTDMQIYTNDLGFECVFYIVLHWKTLFRLIQIYVNVCEIF